MTAPEDNGCACADCRLYGLGRPGLIDRLPEPGRAPAIAGHAAGSGLRSREAREGAGRTVSEGKIRIFPGSTAAELQGMRRELPALGLGERDTLLLHGRVRSQGRPHCMLDDRDARRAAKSPGMPFTGLLGLLSLLKERGIIGGAEAGEIVKGLRRAGFWMPADAAV